MLVLLVGVMDGRGGLLALDALLTEGVADADSGHLNGDANRGMILEVLAASCPDSGVMPVNETFSLSFRNEREMEPITASNPVVQPCRLYCLVDFITFRLNRMSQGKVC